MAFMVGMVGNGLHRGLPVVFSVRSSLETESNGKYRLRLFGKHCHEGIEPLMNILILTFGSRGDVQPYVALGKGLKARGHTVTICTCSRFGSFVTDHGLIHAHADDGILEMMDSAEGRGAMEDANSVFGTLKTMRRLWSRVNPIMRQMLQDSWEAARGAEPDIII